MRGYAIPLSRPRRFITDLMHFAAGVPTVPVQRRVNLAPVIAARRAAADRPSWTAIFTKAYSLVADATPELRRAYVKFPRPHLYEYPASIASVAVERDFHGEKAVLGLPVKNPSALSLGAITKHLRDAVDAPLENVKSFRRAMKVAGYPRPLRRLMWWFGLNVGRQRANFFGTFAVSVYSALGAESLHPISPCTTLLNYGVFDEAGRCDVRVVYDHRVLDGANVARALRSLEDVLRGPIVAELRSLPPARDDEQGRSARADAGHDDLPPPYQMRETEESWQERLHQP